MRHALCLFNQFSDGRQILLQAVHENIVMVGAGNPQKRFVGGRTGVIERLSVRKWNDVIEPDRVIFLLDSNKWRPDRALADE